LEIRVAIDVGGSFTDLVGLNEETGEIYTSKTQSTSNNPVQALLNAFREAEINLEDVATFIYGTTVATNCIVQRKGSEMMFFTTEGFEDILYIQRGDREKMFDLQWIKPKPLVKRRNCQGIRERINHKGKFLVPLKENEVRERLENLHIKLKEENIHSFAVSLLFSYVNEKHEKILKKFLHELYPQIPVSVSHEIAPIWREYDRSSTACVDAYIKPVMKEHITKIDKGLRSKGYVRNWAVAKCNTGIEDSKAAMETPIHTLLSGPAGGVIAGKLVSEQCGFDNAITADMGGTSFDVSIIHKGESKFATRMEIEWGIPVCVPTVDIHTIGAGGGSIGWVDEGGLLHVGPQSAGADPGPACYDKGGRNATVTDANLILGRLNADYFLGGRMKINPFKAYEAIEYLSKITDSSLPSQAQNMLDVVDTNMSDAIRLITIERGLDPRNFALVAFGGAGPLHASSIAQIMGIQTIIVPRYPGLICALGFLMTDLRVDRVWTKAGRSDTVDVNNIDLKFKKLEKQAFEDLAKQGFKGTPIFSRTIGMRYYGQNYESEIPISGGQITEDVMKSAYQKFHGTHKEYYGYFFKDEIIEFTDFKVTAFGPMKKPRFKVLSEKPRKLRCELRDVSFQGECLKTRIYKRADFYAGLELEGPAIIEQEDSTILCAPRNRLKVDRYGNIIMSSRR
jgi:N-methylhydantoinase A